jgi:hypothetical protein
LNLTERDHTDTWVFDFHRNQFSKITLDLIGDTLTAGGNGFAMFDHE